MTLLNFPGISVSTLGAISIGGPCRISQCGDSILADSMAQGSITISNWGTSGWFRRYMGRRIDFPMSRCYAVAGATVNTMLASQIPQAAADNSDIVIVHIGKNSIGVETDTTIQSEMQTSLDTLRAAGKLVIVIPVRCCNSPNAWSTQAAKQVGRMTRFLYQYCRSNPGALFFNWDPYIVDFTTGNAQSQYLRDGIHDNQISAKLLGSQLATYLTSFIPTQDAGIVQLNDVYDATFNPAGNLFTNGLLAGTGGTTQNGATGSVPTGWVGRFGGAQNTSTLAFSKITDPTYSTLTRAVMTIGGTGDQNNCILSAPNPTLATLGVSVGDTIEFEAEVSWSFTSGSFGSVWIECDVLNSGFGQIGAGSIAYDGFSPSNGTLAAADSSSGTLFFRTPPITVPATANYIIPQVICAPPASGACAGTVTIGRVALRKTNVS